VAGVEDFRRDMKSFVENVARHCTAEKLLKMAFSIQMATRWELNLLFNANKDSLMQKGVSIHQKRWVGKRACGGLGEVCLGFTRPRRTVYKWYVLCRAKLATGECM